MLIHNQIKTLLKRDYPMLLIDGVSDCVPNKSCKAFKNLSYNEWFFPQHFPDSPIFPGSLQLEAFTQAFSIPLLHGNSNSSPVPILLASLDKARFYKSVIPGDRFEIDILVERIAMGLASGTATGSVNGEKVSECRITYKLID
jgi:3-hydroxyacyl-[acyl-carrier-protein] dehydratase